MNWIDLSYLTFVSGVGGLARAMERGLPEKWRLRLNAKPPEDLSQGWIWLHAVSVGELILAEGILNWLKTQGYAVHITTGTSAGLALLQKRLPGWDRGSGRITGGAFPLDDAAGLRPFLNPPPAAMVILETELWPNLLRELDLRGIPCAIVNGRLTDRSLGKGRKWLAQAASRLNLVAARDEISARAFQDLGVRNVILGGNLKADLPNPSPLHEGWDWLRQAWSGCPILVAGNTVDGEESLVLEAWRRARQQHRALRLIVAPRQPKRFQEVADQFSNSGLSFRRASDPWPSLRKDWEACEVLLLDTLGELPSAYREGTVALVGGGWKWYGGHNPLEPVRWGLPTLIGPRFGNFEDLVMPLLDTGQVEIVDEGALVSAVSRILDETPLRPGKSGSKVDLPAPLVGALARTCEELKTVLPSSR